VVVHAGAQADAPGLALRVRAGGEGGATVPLASLPAPAWRERGYAAELAWPGGRLPIRVQVTGVARGEPARFAYLRAVEVLRIDPGAPPPGR
jgi:hypothetical protein